MKKLLLHCCCAPCLTYPVKSLENDFNITCFFFNNNIHPLQEYDKRLNEFINYTSSHTISYKVQEPNFDEWYNKMKGLENHKEGQQRCWRCYEIRLEKTALEAKIHNFDAFTTVLSISPHKNSKKINEIGLKLADKYQIQFLEKNFKKNNGFKISSELSKAHNLYRQDYCGCIFSIRNNKD